MNEFDLKAAEWDQNPIIWERATAIANEMKRIIPLKKHMTGLEFGAGTGVTSFMADVILLLHKVLNLLFN